MAQISILFFFSPLYGRTTFLLSIDGHLDFLQFGAVANNDVMNIHMQVFVWIYVSMSLG